MHKQALRLAVLFLTVCHAVPQAFGNVSASLDKLRNAHGIYFSYADQQTFNQPARFFFPAPADSAKRAEIRALKADTVYHHIRRDAALWSAFIPGAGQIYNEMGYRKIPKRKNMAWWKVPIIYGGLGTIGYYFYQNLATARALKAEWIYRDNGYGDYLYPEYELWDKQWLLDGNPATSQIGFDEAAKRRDMLGFGFIALWGLQVIEAYVDAHFVTFDVSEDLSLSWSPAVLPFSTPGLALRLEMN